MVCHCKDGYEGPKCDRCAAGWFGQPHRHGGSCQPCQCDPLGSVGEECDVHGQCECLPGKDCRREDFRGGQAVLDEALTSPSRRLFSGVSGARCNVCPTRQVLTAHGVCSTCDDACTGDLLRGIEDLAFDLEVGAGKTVGGVLEAPWAVLEGIHAEAKGARGRLDALRHLADKAGEVQSELRKPANQAVKEVGKGSLTFRPIPCAGLV